MMRLAVSGGDRSEQPIADRIAALEVRLRDMSAERDRAQERLSEWEKKQANRAADTPSQEKQAAPEPARSAIEVPVTEDPVLQARLVQVAAALTESRAERAALLAAKQKLMAEIADLYRDLKAVPASASAASTPATLQEGGAHANG
jgi:chromosome segregation ATPase